MKQVIKANATGINQRVIGAFASVFFLLSAPLAHSDGSPIPVTYLFTQSFDRTIQISPPLATTRDHFATALASFPTPIESPAVFFAAGASKAAGGAVGVYSTTTGNPIWVSGAGSVSGDGLGYSVAVVGDSNHDGTSDVVAGAPQDQNLTYGSGYAQVRSGVNGALLHTFTGGGVGDQVGWAVSPVPDLNGDGTSEIVLGAPQKVINGRGYFAIYNGAAPYNRLFQPYLGLETSGSLGQAFAVGNFTGGGGLDLAVAAPGVATNRGRVYIWTTDQLRTAYLNGSTQIPAPSFTLSPSNGAIAAGTNFGATLGVVAAARSMGYTTTDARTGAGTPLPIGFPALIRDILLVGAPGAVNQGNLSPVGAVYKYANTGAGSTIGLQSVFYGTLAGQSFGDSVAGVSDLTGDGVSEVLVGNTNYGVGALYAVGQVTVHDGVSNAIIGSLQPSVPYSRLRFGWSTIATGARRFIVGQPFMAGPTSPGRALAYSAPTIVSGQGTPPIGTQPIGGLLGVTSGGGQNDPVGLIGELCRYTLNVIGEGTKKTFAGIQPDRSNCSISRHEIAQLLNNSGSFAKAAHGDTLCVQTGLGKDGLLSEVGDCQKRVENSHSLTPAKGEEDWSLAK